MSKKKFKTYRLVTPKGSFSVICKARKLKPKSVTWEKPPIGFRPVCFGCGGEQA